MRDMLKRILLGFLVSILLTSLVKEVNAESQVCVVYFTYIGCPNCAVTDPIVLKEWTGKYDDLVVIEYMWDARKVGWNHPNARLLGEYAQKYGTQAAVPQLFISEKRIRVGRLDVPSGEEDIKNMKSNPCLLLDGSVPFNELNLSELLGKPKIWANKRILIYSGNDEWIFQWDGSKVSEKIVGNKIADEGLLKRLLFSDDIPTILDGIKFEIVEPERVEFSGIAFPSNHMTQYVEFENAVKLNIPKEQSPLTGEVVETPVNLNWTMVGAIMVVVISMIVIIFLFQKGFRVKIKMSD